MNNCPKCGYPISPEEVACTNCGEPVQNINEENVSPENAETTVETTPEEIVNESAVSSAEQMPEESNSKELESTPESETVEIAEETAAETSVETPAVAPTAEVPGIAPEMVPPVSVEAPVVAPTAEMPGIAPEIVPPVSVEAPAVAPTAEVPGIAPEMVPPVSVEAPAVAPTAEMPGIAPEIVPPVSVEAPVVAPTLEVPGIAPGIVPPVSVEPLAVAPTAEVPGIAPGMVPPVSVEAPAAALTPEVPGIAQMVPPVSVEPLAVAPTLEMPGAVTPGMQMAEPANVPNIEVPATSSIEEKTKSPAKKDGTFNKIIFIIVILISLLAIGLLSFFSIKLFSNENIVVGNNIAETAKEYHYEGFNLYIEEKDKDKNDIYAEVYNGEFYVGSDTWSAVMTLQTGTYNTLLSNKSQLVDYFKDMGYEATEPVEKEISGTAFVKMEVMMGSKNILVAYAKANGTKVFGIVLENETGEYTDDDLKVIGTILSTSKYVGPKYSLPEGLQFDQFKETFMVAE